MDSGWFLYVYQIFSPTSRRENYKDKWDEHCATMWTTRSDRLNPRQSWEGSEAYSSRPRVLQADGSLSGAPASRVQVGALPELVALDFPLVRSEV